MIKLLGYGNVYIGVVEAGAADGSGDKRVGVIMSDRDDMGMAATVGTPYDAKPDDFVMIFDHEDAIDILESSLKKVRMMLKQYEFQKELLKEGFGGDEQTKH